jgi:hypothetical protein
LRPDRRTKHGCDGPAPRAQRSPTGPPNALDAPRPHRRAPPIRRSTHRRAAPYIRKSAQISGSRLCRCGPSFARPSLGLGREFAITLCPAPAWPRAFPCPSAPPARVSPRAPPRPPLAPLYPSGPISPSPSAAPRGTLIVLRSPPFRRRPAPPPPP